MVGAHWGGWEDIVAHPIIGLFVVEVDASDRRSLLISLLEYGGCPIRIVGRP